MKSGFQESNPQKKFVSLGMVSEQPLTYGTNADGDNDAKTVTAAAGDLRAAVSATAGRQVLIFVPASEDTGIHVGFGEDATTNMLFVPAGGTLKVVTEQRISAIRAAAATANVTVYVLVGTVA